MAERNSVVHERNLGLLQKYAVISGVTYDVENRTLISPEGETILEPRVSDVLMRLLTTDGPVSRKEFLDEIWGVTGSDEALTQAISRLRRVMLDTERPYKVIKTVPRGGYILGVEMEWTDSIQKPSATLQSRQPASLKAWIRQNRSFLTGVLLGAAGTFVAMLIWMSARPSSGITNISG